MSVYARTNTTPIYMCIYPHIRTYVRGSGAEYELIPAGNVDSAKL